MSTKDICLLGEGALHILHDNLEARLKNWAADWCINASSRFNVTKIQRASDTDREYDWQAAQPDSAALFIAISGGAATLASLLLEDLSSISIDHERLGRMAMDELATALGTPCDTNTDAELDPWMFQPFAGSVIATLTLGDHEILLLLAPALVDTLAPRSPVKSALALVSRKESIGNAMLALHVSLNLGKLYLQDLHNLQIGDCIPTRVPLDVNFDLMLDGTRIANCRLGRNDGRRAVLLEST